MANSNRMTAEEIEARVWAFVIVSLVVILLGSMAMFLYSVSFVTQPMSGLAPIDKVYTQQISTIMVFVSGVLGGVAGRSGVKAMAKAVASAEATDNDPPPQQTSTPKPPLATPRPIVRPLATNNNDDDDPPFKGARE